MRLRLSRSTTRRARSRSEESKLLRARTFRLPLPPRRSSSRRRSSSARSSSLSRRSRIPTRSVRSSSRASRSRFRYAISRQREEQKRRVERSPSNGSPHVSQTLATTSTRYNEGVWWPLLVRPLVAGLVGGVLFGLVGIPLDWGSSAFERGLRFALFLAPALLVIQVIDRRREYLAIARRAVRFVKPS
jgi:hypothetical protein